MKKTGRPRKFDVDTALNQAVTVFFAKGYDATTIDDLTQAMGIQRPSLYSAFGNKESLFLKVLERYRETCIQGSREILGNEPDGKQAISRFLERRAECHIESDWLGCLVVNSSVDCQPMQEGVGDRIRQIHDQNEALIYQRLQQALADGDLSAEADIRGLAQFYNGVIQGMGVLARGQRSPDAVRQMARFAMAAWPELEGG